MLLKLHKHPPSLSGSCHMRHTSHVHITHVPAEGSREGLPLPYRGQEALVRTRTAPSLLTAHCYHPCPRPPRPFPHCRCQGGAAAAVPRPGGARTAQRRGAGGRTAGALQSAPSAQLHDAQYGRLQAPEARKLGVVGIRAVHIAHPQVCRVWGGKSVGWGM